MDVRAVDTSTLAAKRVEMEPVEPEKEKRAFIVDRITPRTSHEAGGRVSRLKSSTERGAEQNAEHEDHEAVEEQGAPAAESDAEGHGPPITGSEHILDVKV